MILIGIVNLEKLLIKVKCMFKNECHSRIFLQLVKVFGEKPQPFNHHLLGIDHHLSELEGPAQLHIFDGREDKFFNKELLCLLIFEHFFDVVDGGDKFYPGMNINDIGEILPLIVAVDHVDFIQFNFEAFDGERVVL